ncbi:MAG: hypothetical protein ACJAUY_000923 [Cognaticolwellia sp.]|jgi:hypothetical protein
MSNVSYMTLEVNYDMYTVKFRVIFRRNKFHLT